MQVLVASPVCPICLLLYDDQLLICVLNSKSHGRKVDPGSSSTCWKEGGVKYVSSSSLARQRDIMRCLRGIYHMRTDGNSIYSFVALRNVRRSKCCLSDVTMTVSPEKVITECSAKLCTPNVAFQFPIVIIIETRGERGRKESARFTNKHNLGSGGSVQTCDLGLQQGTRSLRKRREKGQRKAS
jgi:hypothetical protein